MSVRIAVDAMGGDNAPHEVVMGAVQALQNDKDLEVLLIGNEEKIKTELTHANFDKEIEIVHTDEWVGMDEPPKKALEAKKNASINIATKLLNEDKAGALVSAGNTGESGNN